MRTWLIFATMFASVIAYWLSIIIAARLLPMQRRKAGDTRPVPSLFDPATSHHWFGITLTEKTSAYSLQTRRAFHAARISLGVIPVGFVLAMTIANSGGGPTPGAPPLQSAPPPVTLDIENDR